MPKGLIRAYQAENQQLNNSIPYQRRAERALFRANFETKMKATADTNATDIQTLKWGAGVILPEGLSATEWTKISYQGQDGFVPSEHVVELAYVKKKSSGTNRYVRQLILDDESEKDVLWGDLVQIIKVGQPNCTVRVRGVQGTMKKSDFHEEALLEAYFIDVAQGDGVLVKTPDGRHLLIDGGLERRNQQTGKNAADFIDWKFFFDYGHYQIQLDGMMASHSDTDHFGGLHDLVRLNKLSRRELDCLGVEIDTFYHPGLSRWTHNDQANPAHKDGLGAQQDGFFIQLLGNRADAEQALDKHSEERLSKPWSYFIRDVLKNSEDTKVERVGIERETLEAGGNFPLLWPSLKDCAIQVLGPVTKRIDGQLGLKDLGDKGKNSNGHSICLRIKYKGARVLMTGDLNKKSMNWIAESYGDRIGAWACDVAKACHHGSDDISYRFLEEIKAAATVISSGDAEGHAHPRPDIVAASAVTGFVTIDRRKDKLITPLVYMTEIERSVSLGAINRIDIDNSIDAAQSLKTAFLSRHIDELNDRAFLSPEQREHLETLATSDAIKDFLKEVKRSEKSLLKTMEDNMERNNIKVDFNITIPKVPFGSTNVNKRAWRARVMEKNHYGLVNIRTDGDTIICATLNETEQKWIVHSFPARF